MSAPTVKLGISTKFHNKDKRPKKIFAQFPTASMSLDKLTSHITSGHAISCGVYRNGHRSKANWQSSQLLALDFDKGVSVQDALQHPIIKAYAFLVHPSSSSSPALRKTRVLFKFDQVNTDLGRYEMRLQALATVCNDLKPDPTCIEAAHFYYGSDNKSDDVYTNFDAILPVAVLDTLIDTQSRLKASQPVIERAPRKPVETVAYTVKTGYADAELTALQAAYREAVSKLGGRNRGLFTVALFAYRNGIPQKTVVNELLQLHIDTPPLEAHAAEDSTDRRNEGLRTIASAYSGRYYGSDEMTLDDGTPGLPNAAREMLLASTEPQAARVIDAMILLYEPGETFTVQDAYQRMKDAGIKIKRQTVSEAVGMMSDVALYSVAFGEVSQEIIGRPATVYVVPSVDEICQSLGVSDQSTYALELDDMVTMSTYRMAFHEVYLRENEGQQVPMGSMTRRLGVRRETVWRYHRRLGVVSVPIYDDIPITQDALDLVPVQPSGRYKGILLIINGQYTSPRREYAQNGLHAGLRVVLRQYQPSRYYFTESIDEAPAAVPARDWQYFLDRLNWLVSRNVITTRKQVIEKRSARRDGIDARNEYLDRYIVNRNLKQYQGMTA